MKGRVYGTVYEDGHGWRWAILLAVAGLERSSEIFPSADAAFAAMRARCPRVFEQTPYRFFNVHVPRHSERRTQYHAPVKEGGT